MSVRWAVAAASEIGRHLVETAVWWEDRCAWRQTSLGQKRGAEPLLLVGSTDGSLYSGTAGIAAFLDRLAATDLDPRIRETAAAARRHASAWAARDDVGPGLYAGRCGVRWAGLTIPSPDAGAQGESDIVAGVAGSVLAALGTGDLDAAGHGCDILLARARPRTRGTSWATGATDDRLDDLLGMAHGASGIGLALAEAAAALGREDAAHHAREAFRYERVWFDAAQGNWPDLRRVTRTGAPGPSFMTAWCHGAAGIALARIRAWRRLGDPFLREEAVVALDATARWTERALDADGADYCLCHGLAGNADILLEGARALPARGAAWARLALDVAKAGVARYPARGVPWPCGPGSTPDPSLMVGIAGVGHLLLRISDPTIGSVLAIERRAADRSASVPVTIQGG